MPQKTKGAKRHRLTEEEREKRIDESLKDSFPASDPPSHSGAVPGGPRRNRTGSDADDKKRQRKR